MAKLQLHYNIEFDRYVLRGEDSVRDDESYEMVLGKFDREYSYHFLVWEMGEWYEMITRKDYEQRIQDIKDHECDEVADIWAQHQECYRIVSEHHPVFKLQKQWEAIVELGLLDIPSHYREWQGKPLSEEAVDLMHAARVRWMEEESR
jgi:hypothetical protein